MFVLSGIRINDYCREEFGKFWIFSKSTENGQFSWEIREFSGLKRFSLVFVTIVTLRPYSVNHVRINEVLLYSCSVKNNLNSNLNLQF